jgi:hypothetical protein
VLVWRPYPFHSRICLYLNVPPQRLATHCKHMFPREYFRYKDFRKLRGFEDLNNRRKTIAIK